MFTPIGTVENSVNEKFDRGWGDVVSDIMINEELVPGLKGLDTFSHIIVITQLHEADFAVDKHLLRKPQGRTDMPMVGIFAQRAKNRPNPIGITAVELLRVEGNTVRVIGLDAINGTPVLDIKPYYPQYDQRVDAKVPGWVDRLMGEYF